MATFLAVALNKAGFAIAEIVARDSPRSLQRARALAAKVGARAVTVRSTWLDAELLWFCVPDREIRRAASVLASRLHRLGNNPAAEYKRNFRFAFHSSGALQSGELDPLREAGIAVASVHPLMTFVTGAHPSLAGVPFAIEGDAAAARVAKRIVRQLGRRKFLIAGSLQSRVSRVGYHDLAPVACIPGDARRSRSCRRICTGRRPSQELAHYQADFGKLLATRPR